MNSSADPPSKEDFEEVDWLAIPRELPSSNVRDYANRYYDRAAAAREGGDQRAERAYRLLGDVCSYSLCRDESEQPFRPWIVTENLTSASPDQLTQEDTDRLRSLLPAITDSALRSRIADLAWVRARDYRAAEVAVDAYLDLSRRLQEEEYPDIQYLERALQLAAQLGRRGDKIQQVEAYVLSLLDERRSVETGFVSRELLRWLPQYRLGDLSAAYVLAVEHAERAESERAWHRSEAYWNVAVDLAEAIQDRDRRREALRRLAEQLVQRAEADADQPHTGKLVAVMHLQRAIGALRRASGLRERVDEVHVLMMEYQREIPETLVPHTYRLDIGEAVRDARQAVAGKSLEEALLAFAVYPDLPSFVELRARAEEGAQRFHFGSLFPAVQLNGEGKVVARQGSTDSSDPQQREAALRVNMLQDAKRHHQVVGKSSVEAAMMQIREDHALRVHDFLPFLAHNPLVPEGRELLYAEAFYAGFMGDLPKAIHVLVHQVEHSIRELLERAGVIVTKIDQYGLQSERNLNQLLYEAKLKEMLGPDLVFALQGLLVEKFGSDIRNRVAHGLMGYEEFYSYECLYLWWLCFRLCCTPVLHAIRRQEEDALPGPGAAVDER